MFSFRAYNFNVKCLENVTDLREYIKNKSNVHLLTINGEFLNCAKNDLEFSNIIQNNINVIDTVSILWIVNYLRKNNKNFFTWLSSGISAIINTTTTSRISGSDLFPNVKEYFGLENPKILMLGGTEGTAEIIADKFSNLNVKGYSKFTVKRESIKEFNDIMVNKLLSENFDIVFVGLGSPLQELFITEMKNKFNAKVWVGVGGALDYWSGHKCRAPKIVRILGLEWLHRLIHEPKRINRIINAWKPVIDLLFNKF